MMTGNNIPPGYLGTFRDGYEAGYAAARAADRAEVEQLREHSTQLRQMIVDSAAACTLKGCKHCKWLGFNLGRYESDAALAAPGRMEDE